MASCSVIAGKGHHPPSLLAHTFSLIYQKLACICPHLQGGRGLFGGVRARYQWVMF